MSSALPSTNSNPISKLSATARSSVDFRAGRTLHHEMAAGVERRQHHFDPALPADEARTDSLADRGEGDLHS